MPGYLIIFLQNEFFFFFLPFFLRVIDCDL